MYFKNAYSRTKLSLALSSLVAGMALPVQAQVMLEEGKGEEAGTEAYRAMIKAAKALVLIQYDDVTDDDLLGMIILGKNPEHLAA